MQKWPQTPLSPPLLFYALRLGIENVAHPFRGLTFCEDVRKVKNNIHTKIKKYTFTPYTPYNENHRHVFFHLSEGKSIISTTRSKEDKLDVAL